VGVHTGECELVGDKPAGIAVHTGARIAAAAKGGEILVSRTVKDLVGGSGISFDDRGTLELKGVPDEWRLYAVTSLSPRLGEPASVSRPGEPPAYSQRVRVFQASFRNAPSTSPVHQTFWPVGPHASSCEFASSSYAARIALASRVRVMFLPRFE
jgi:hypothetical protein